MALAPTLEDQMACSELFTNLIVNLGSGEIKHCCKTIELDPFTVDDLSRLGSGIFDRNDQIMQARAEMLMANRLPRICQQCHNAGPGSFFRLRNKFDHVLTDAEKIDLMLGRATDNYEIVVGNSCDLRCVYCHEGFSTAWAAEKGLPPARSAPGWTEGVTDALIQHMDARYGQGRGHGKTIYVTLTGGEPTYIPNGLHLLQQIARRFPDVNKEFLIITNGNTKPAVLDRWIDAMRANTDVLWTWAFSLDDLGQRCEAIRYGLHWDSCMANMDRLMAMPNALVYVNPTFNAFSIPNCKEFIRFFVELFGSKGLPVSFGDNMVNNRGIGVKSLPPHYVSHIDDAIAYCESIPRDANWLRRDRWMSHLRSVRATIGTSCTPDDLAAMQASLRYLADRRGDVDMMSLFPHLSDVINWYSTNVREAEAEHG